MVMDFGYAGPTGWMFGTVFPVIFIIIFFIVIGMFVLILVRGVHEWHGNNQSPVLTVEASVVTKRQDVSHHHDHHDHHHHATVWYYVTFQVESGDRMEFGVAGTEFGLLAEGDHGRLTFQGSRYLGFERA